MNAGKTKIAIDTGTLADGDSIAAYVTAAAGLLVTSTTIGADEALDVNVVQSALPAGAATEATLATRASEATLATRASEATLASVLAELAALSHAEDAPHVSGDMGTMPLAVRNDAGTALAGTNGDYIPLTTDATGALWTRVTGTVTANVEGDYAEDSPHVSGDLGLFGLAVRNDNQTLTLTSTDGDYSGVAVDKKGAQYVKDVANGANLQQIVTVGTTATALPGTALADRVSMFIQMLSGGLLFLGSATVTNTGPTRGLSLGNGGFVSLSVGPGAAIFGVGSVAGREVAVWEFA